MPGNLLVFFLATAFSLFFFSQINAYHLYPRINSTSAKNPNQTCDTIHVRREWRTLSREDKAAYINAVKCLAKKPSRLIGTGYRRFDDFQYVHCEMRGRVHFTAFFLAWHHVFLLAWEKALQEECDYSGALPYWQWDLDAENFPRSPLWSADPVTGFGTNGANFSYDPDKLGGGIVTDGAFAKWRILYPDKQFLERNFHLPSTYIVKNHTWGSQYYNKHAMDWVLRHTSYAKFSTALEGTNPIADEDYPGPHGILHALLGGDMPKLSYAANEPVFYLLHSYVDKNWWTWINRDLSRRMHEFNGNKTPGKTDNDASLDDELDFLGLTPKIKVRDIMKWGIPPFCYTYERDP